MASKDSGIFMTPRAPSPPWHMTFSARNVIPPNFTAFSPREVRASKGTSFLTVTQVGWNIDGRKLATCGNEKFPRIWEPEKAVDAKQTIPLTGCHTTTATAFAWSTKHPEYLCSFSEDDKKMAFWDVRAKLPIQTLTTRARLSQMRYSPDGEGIMTVDEDSIVSTLIPQKQADLQKVEWQPNPDVKYEPENDITDFKFNHVGDLVFLSTTRGAVMVLEYPTLRRVENIDLHVGACTAVDLDPKGRFMATGGSDAIINIYDIVEMMPTRTLSVVDVPIRGLSYSFDGEYLAVASTNSSIIIASSVTGQPLHRGVPLPGPPASIAWSPSKHILASCGDHPSASGGGWISCFGLL
ncbi:hypothetical protein FRC02_008761 [Tulasnella sp. 418]|nr:hypothetical protein FRC02_008761 [Tulasnella sp. 418]